MGIKGFLSEEAKWGPLRSGRRVERKWKSRKWKWKTRRHHPKLLLCPSEFIPEDFSLQGPGGRGGGMGRRGNTPVMVYGRKAE